MTAKEKAEDLFSTFCIYPLLKEQAKFLCLKAVDEILNNFGSTADGKHFYTAYSTLEYWQEVKQEIINL